MVLPLGLLALAAVVSAQSQTEAYAEARNTFFRQHALRYSFACSVTRLPQSGGNSLAPLNFTVGITSRMVSSRNASDGSTSTETGVPFDQVKSIEAYFSDIAAGRAVAEPNTTAAVVGNSPRYDLNIGFPLRVVYTGFVVDGEQVEIRISSFVRELSDVRRDELEQTMLSSLAIWQRLQLRQYHYTVQRTCNCEAELTEPVVVSIDHGHVTDVFTRSGQTLSPIGYKSIDLYFVEVDNAIDQAQLDSLFVTYDASQGYPTQIRYDLGDAQSGVNTSESLLQTVHISGVSASVAQRPANRSSTTAFIVVAVLIVVLIIGGLCAFFAWKHKGERSAQEEKPAERDFDGLPPLSGVVPPPPASLPSDGRHAQPRPQQYAPVDKSSNVAYSDEELDEVHAV